MFRNTMMRSRWIWLWLPVIVCVLFWRFLVYQDVPLLPYGDSELVLTHRLAATRCVAEGRLPLWDPFLCTGLPLFADPHTPLFDVTNVVYLIWRPVMAHVLRIMSCFLMAGLGAYVFLRKYMGVAPVSALVGAVVFMLNGHFFWYFEISMAVAFAQFLPWILFCYGMSLEKRSWRYALAAGVLIAGATHVSYHRLPYLVMAIAVFQTVRSVGTWRAEGFGAAVRELRYVVMAGAVAAGLSIVLLLPALELARASSRGAFRYGGLGVKGLLFYIGGFFFADGWQCIERFFAAAGHLKEGTKAHIGLVPFMLAAIGILGRRDRRTVPLFVMGLFFPLWWFLSVCPGLRQVWAKVFPLFTTLNYSYGLILYTLPMALMAGVGFDLLLKSSEGQREAEDRSGAAVGAPVIPLARWIRPVAIVLGVGFSVALAALLVGCVCRAWLPELLAKTYVAWRGDRLINAPAFYFGKMRYLYDQVVAAAPCLATSFAANIVAVFTLGAWLKNSSRPFPARVMAACVALNLIGVGWQYMPRNKMGDFYPNTKAIQFLKNRDMKDCRMGVMSLMISERSGEPVPIDDFQRLLDCTVANATPLAHAGALYFRIPSMGGVCSLSLRRFFQYMQCIRPGCSNGRETYLLPKDLHSPLLDLLNVRYVLCPQGQTAEGFQLLCEGEDYSVYARPSALPRAFCVPTARYLAGTEAILNELRRPDFSPLDGVLIEGTAKADEVQPPEAKSVATVVDAQLSSVTVEVQAEGPCWLVLCDAFYPGWKATVNGAPAQIVPAYHLFRAVQVPKGKSLVRFVYRPFPLLVGASITLATVLILVFVLIAVAVRSARRSRAA